MTGVDAYQRQLYISEQSSALLRPTCAEDVVQSFQDKTGTNVRRCRPEMISPWLGFGGNWKWGGLVAPDCGGNRR